jgi:hypothetical protein
MYMGGCQGLGSGNLLRRVVGEDGREEYGCEMALLPRFVTAPTAASMLFYRTVT